MSPSSFKDDFGNKLGSGDVMKISGRYSFPFSVKQNNAGRPILWAASVSGAYAKLNNRNMTEQLNPGDILNTSINLTHMRPVTDRWSMVATLGAGIYSSPEDICWNSILVNGGLIFMYKILHNLDVGIGVGLTNSYGVPLVMPMSYINWRLSGRYEVKVDITNSMEISGAIRFNDKFKLRLVAIEMGGMSSVMNVQNESMIYAYSTMQSYLCPEYRINKSSVLYMGIGGTWLRDVTFAKRTFRGFWDSMFHDDRELHFETAGYVTLGLKYGF